MLIEIVATMTAIMIGILIVLAAVIVLNLILVNRMKVLIVVLAALVQVVARTTIICSNKLSIDTNHSNSNGCSNTTTTANIKTNTTHDGSSNGSNNRFSAHFNIKKLFVTVVVAA